MKTLWLGCLLACPICLPVLVQSQDTGYQAGKIVNVEKLPGRPSSGGTDAQVKPDVSTYNISIQVADTVYVCRYQADSEQDLSWIQGKDVQVKIAGKKMYVQRASGKDAKAGILRTTKAGIP